MRSMISDCLMAMEKKKCIQYHHGNAGNIVLSTVFCDLALISLERKAHWYR